MWGLTVNSKHTYTDYGLGCTSCTLSPPEPRIYTVDIPGADGVLDTTAARGRVTYKNRTLTAEFDKLYNSRAAFESACAALNTAMHGRAVTIVMDGDAAHYLTGRAKWQHSADGNTGLHTLTVDCAPYRMRAAETVEVYTVTDSLEITLQNAQKAVIPLFETEDTGMRVSFKTATYSLLTGGCSIPEICLAEGANTLTLLGSGTVTVRYREGEL